MNKYQMQNIELLLDNNSQTIKSDVIEQTLFSTLELRYPYSQTSLDQRIREQGNFSLIWGNTKQDFIQDSTASICQRNFKKQLT